MKTGEVIRALRKQKGLTLAEVESRAGLSDGNLSRIERGEQWLSEEKLFSVADALGVTPADFFTGPQRENVASLLSLVDQLGDNVPALPELLEVISGFWNATKDGKKQILRSVKLAEKIKSGGSTAANDKR